MQDASQNRQFGATLAGATPKQLSRVEQATAALEKSIYDAFDAVSTLEHRLTSVLAPPPPLNEVAGTGVPTANSVAAQLEDMTRRVIGIATRVRAIESRLEV